MKEGKRYYFEGKSRETSKARVRGSARDAAEMSGWRARFDCTLSVHSTWFRFHARETGIKREREQERRWERRACTIEASFSRTSKRFCVLPWRGVSSRAIMQADSNGDLAFPITNFHRYLSRTLSTTRIFCKSRRYNFLVIFWYIKKEKKIIEMTLRLFLRKFITSLKRFIIEIEFYMESLISFLLPSFSALIITMIIVTYIAFIEFYPATPVAFSKSLCYFEKRWNIFFIF